MRLSELIKGLGNPVAYFPELARCLGDVNDCIILSQLIYWSDKGNKDGWFYKSADELEKETAINYYQQLKSRKRLKKLGILKEEHRRLEHRIYFKINVDVLDQYFIDYLDRKIGENEKRSFFYTTENAISGGQNANFEQNQTISKFGELENLKMANFKISNSPSLNFKTRIHETTTETNTENTNKITLLWNEFARKHNLATINKLTDKRRTKLNARLKEKDFDFEKILDLVARSKFLLGSNKSGWKVDFDWLIKNNENYTKILEGNYGIEQKKRYSYAEVLEKTGGQIAGKFKKSEDGFWYEQ